ncbi:hypothetical protein K2173_018673 [Erythroxylum novogranatense]|uniref:Xyloglucan endotransglucosylase/hydrolase n=1 Tax=Erythroxylum novogranatense TaxID=1862640 RepID=A0AAV8SAK5_9ROSI|nr:hypothetical protein K2173_018673 [Erythroxylum novogranatense]
MKLLAANMFRFHVTEFPCFLTFFLFFGYLVSAKGDISFDQNYYITWGNKNVLSLQAGAEVQLSLDNSTGSGLGSKLNYISGFFTMRIKLPGPDSAGVVTTFYLSSHSDNHDELDLEFLGNKEGKPIILQTNVFSNGEGNREERILFWFDPTADFHNYSVLWNAHLIVFFVDHVPIRVFDNKTNIGVRYPSQPMQVLLSLWDGSSWATGGGKTKIDWSHAPFKAYFQGFGIKGCAVVDQSCYFSKYWWNSISKLKPTQQSAYENVRKNYLIYDYCFDRKRFPKPAPECH